MKRLVINIDEEKCDGCGACVPSCAEGALRIIDGKARLVSDVLCDGLGACLGECPQGALKVEEREAPAFDEQAVHVHLAASGRTTVPHTVPVRPQIVQTPAEHAHMGGCPGSRSMSLPRTAVPRAEQPAIPTAAQASELVHWPVQMMLLPVRAPYFQGADLLLCADCVPFAYPNFHRDLLRGHVLAVGCPKLDDANFYVEKLGAILRDNDVKSVTVAHMEVPCCFGLTRVVREALALSGKSLPVRDVTVGVDGERK
ncbi:MAG: ATP-binding protein [Chloroflexota bacterium]